MVTMDPEDRARICAISTIVARELIRTIDPPRVQDCDIIVEEYCSSDPGTPGTGTDKPHGFIGIDSFLCNELPAAIICGIIVEVIKFYVIDLLPRSSHRKRKDCVEVLSRQFLEEARREGLEDTRAAELRLKFHEFLLANPQVLTKNP
jgi:hypothetical protein